MSAKASRLILESPTTLRIVGLEDPHGTLKAKLTVTNKSKNFEYLKFKKNVWYQDKHGIDAYEAELKRLKDDIRRELLESDGEDFTTLSGFASELSKMLHLPVENQIEYPESKLLGWHGTPFKLRDYQENAVQKLLEAKHACVSLATGTGKSACILELVKRLGLKTVIMTPATNISEQLYEDAVRVFGKGNVGRFFDGKKEFKKKIVIANGQSLTNVRDGSDSWDALASAQVFITDESHGVACATFEKVALGLLADAPYRFFFSATQTRNDGQEKLLDGIIGPIVATMDAREAIELGWLAKPYFKLIRTTSDSSYQSSDVNNMTRHHLYYNDNVVRQVANAVNAACSANMPTLVLIEEVGQFAKLLPYLQYKPEFAHGPLSDNKDKVPKDYHDSDVRKLVDDFNDMKIPLLIGTSCISCGTDIRPVRLLVYWQGGKSEIQVKQAFGRGTRKDPATGKTDFYVLDFDVTNVEIVSKHAQARLDFYNEIWGPVKEI